MTDSASAAPAQRKLCVDDFEFGKVLGEGAFGDVLLCTEKSTGRKFAAKKIEKEHLKKNNSTKYAVSERDILVACKHPHIIKLYFTFRDTNSLYYILELAPNGELRKLIKKNGNFNCAAAAFYAAEIISALEYLHMTRNIIHRDLKPENLLLSEDMHIKLTDFGTARQLSDGESRVRTGSFLGTAEYISPECLDQEHPEVSKSSDLWALGCIIFQMLAGKPPFHGSTQFLTFDQVQAGIVDFPPHFPRVAKDLILKLLEKDPEQRLGAKSYDELKNHPFFEGIDFSKLIETTPPTIGPNPEYTWMTIDENTVDMTSWKKFVDENEKIQEFGNVELVKEDGEVYKGFLLLTDTHFRVLNRAQNRERKTIKISPKAKISVKDNMVDFTLKNDGVVYQFKDATDADPTRFKTRLRKIKRALNRRS